MKKAMSAILVFIFIICLASCGKTGGQDTAVSQPDDESSTVSVPEETTAAAPSLSAETAAEVLMANKDVWYTVEEYEPLDFSFLDLDFDGTPELVTETIMGTGMFSCNKFFRISEDGLEEIPPAEEIEGDSDYDIFYGDSVGCPKLMQNRETGRMGYFCYDFCRNGYAEHIESRGLLTVSDGKITKESILSSHFLISDDVDPEKINEDDYTTYTYRTEPCDKETYKKGEKQFFSENRELYLNYTVISSGEFEEMSEEEQKQALIDCFNAYSCGREKEASEGITGIAYSYSNSSIYGTDFYGEITDSKVVYARYFDEENNEITKRSKSISPDDWKMLKTTAAALIPNLYEQKEEEDPDMVMLDGYYSSIDITITEDGEEKTVSYIPGNGEDTYNFIQMIKGITEKA